VYAERAAGNDNWGAERHTDHGVVDLPVELGRRLSRTLRSSLPAERSRLVCQVQVGVRVAAGRPRSPSKGTPKRNPFSDLDEILQCGIFWKKSLELHPKGKERKSIYIAQIYTTHSRKALRHGSHRATCKLRHACLSFLSVYQTIDRCNCQS